MTGKTIGHRLFRLGSVPSRRRGALEVEGIRLLEEGIRVTITYRDYRAPGKRFGWKRSVGSGAIVVTRTRLLVLYYRWPILDLPLGDVRLGALDIDASSDRLSISFDAHDLDDARSGRVEIQLRSIRAADIVALTRSAVARR